jgi:hypothetical protein
MLDGYAHIVEFFMSFEWWKTEPHDELVDSGSYCLAKPGELYAVYVPEPRKVKIRLEPGTYEARWFSAVTGQVITLPSVQGPDWTSPEPPGTQDWALLLQKRK